MTKPVSRQQRLLKGFVRFLSLDFRDRLISEFCDCLDDDDEPDIHLDMVDVDCLKKALAKHISEKRILIEAVHWLIKTHCNNTTGLKDVLLFQ